MATLSLTPPSQEDGILITLKTVIFDLWKENHENRYQIGEKLAALQAERAKPGHGTFLDDLQELDIPRHTAYRLINFYKRIDFKVREKMEIQPVRLLQKVKDKWGDVEDEQALHDAEQRADADQRAEAVASFIREEAEKVAKHKADTTKPAPGYRVFLVGLDEADRKLFRTAVVNLGEENATQIIFEAVIDAANKA